jgi:hypothetical protein
MSGPLNADPNKQQAEEDVTAGPPNEQDGPAVTEGPKVNPPSHGDPTNPAQPRT